ATPHMRVKLAAVGKRKRNVHRLAGNAVLGGLAQERQRQAVRVQYRIRFLLPGVTGQRLLEVAGLVKQPDADQRDTEVRCGFEVVAGKDAQATGVLGENLGDAEFRREVGDAGRGFFTQALVPARLAEVAVQIGCSFLYPANDFAVAGQVLQLLPADGPQEGDGVMLRGLPESRVKARKKFPGGPVPGPAQVGRQAGQRPDGLREDGTDCKSSNCLHERHTNGLTWQSELVWVSFR